MTLLWEQVSIDAADPQSLGRWWCEALSWQLVFSDENECEIRQSEDSFPGLLFIRVPDSKAGKNRLHFDFRPSDQESEVARFISIGATHVDIGQGDASWVVLQDPEGNEFCILRERSHSKNA